VSFRKQFNEFQTIRKKFSTLKSLFYFSWKIWFKIHLWIFNTKFSISASKIVNQISESLYILSLLEHSESNLEKNTINFEGILYVIRENTSDFQVFDQIILQRSYQNLVDCYKRTFGQEANLIYDLGANVGYSALFFNKSFGNRCNIKCFEPFDANFNVLKSNIALNKLSNIEVFHNAIWDKNSFLKFNRDFRDNKEWSITISEGNENDYDIIGLSLVELFDKENKIDILKIDIEGTEKVLFENTEYAKKLLRNVKCICIEIHDEFGCRDFVYNNLSNSNFLFFDYLDLTIGFNTNLIKC
jgi:FkbM family methyltransferase